MNIVAELKRNLWVEFTPTKTIIAPLALGVAFFTLYKTDREAVFYMTGLVFAISTLLFGTRAAAQSVISEVNQGTWDGQRMSSQQAWQITFGKLVGATAYYWYLALIPLIIHITAWNIQPPTNALSPSILLWQETMEILDYTLLALLAQAISFSVAIMLFQRNKETRKGSIFFAQLIGLGAAFLLIPSGDFAVLELWNLYGWYGYGIHASYYGSHLWLTASLVGWAWLWALRCVQRELQVSVYGWTWPAFLIYLLFYMTGFYLNKNGVEIKSIDITVLAFVIASGGCYLSLLFSTRDQIDLRRFILHVTQWNFKKTLQWIPSWLSAFLLSVFAVAATLIIIDSSSVLHFDTLGVFIISDIVAGFGAPIIIAALLFLLRDILLFIGLRLGGQRTDILACVLLLINYGVLPFLVRDINQNVIFMHALLPFPNKVTAVVIAPVFFTLVPVTLMTWYNWHRSMKFRF